MTLATVDAERRAACALDVVESNSRKWHREHRRPSALTAREALVALEFEALLIMVAAGNIANGTPLTHEDQERCALAYRRISALMSEVTG